MNPPTILAPNEYVGAIMELARDARQMKGMDYLSEDRVELRVRDPDGAKSCSTSSTPEVEDAGLRVLGLEG